MKFLVEERAQIDIKLAINWLSKKISKEVAREKIKELIVDVKNQLIVHPYSGKHCQYTSNEKYREIIKGDYRTIYTIDKVQDEINIIIIVFCHVKMNYTTLLSQSDLYTLHSVQFYKK